MDNSLLGRLKSEDLSLKRLKEVIYNKSIKNYYVRRFFRMDEREKRGGFTVFIAKNNVLELGILDRVFYHIIRHGFRIITYKILSENEVDKLRHHHNVMYNWNPKVAIPSFDPKPMRLHPSYYQTYPSTDNGRLVYKNDMRASINDELPKNDRAGMLHAPNNKSESWKYVDLIMPERKTYLSEWLSINHPNCPKCGPSAYLLKKDRHIQCTRCTYTKTI